MNQILKKIRILGRTFIGYILKWEIDFNGTRGLSPLIFNGTSDDLIVSLTSYGRRVNKTVYYTLISLLRQTIRPAKIILWLSEEEWSPQTIPNKVNRLSKFGVEIRYCKDLKSYKKFIPTCRLYPENIIVTVDDDMIYCRNMIDSLISSHKINPKAICCNIASKVEINEDGSLKPYRLWKEPVFDGEHPILMPWGCWGILYPPHSLYKDVINENLFFKLCPQADDVWFWGMSELNSTPKLLGNLKGQVAGYSFDDLYQYFHKGAALTHVNDHENRNQEQLDCLVDYYKLKFNKYLEK